VTDDWETSYVEVEVGLRLHVIRAGHRQRPALVLAHGITDDGPCWTVLAEALSTTHDVVMVDARGHGRSDAAASGYGPLDQARDLVAVVQELGLADPTFLGHSMGAATTLALAASYPDLPRAILLEDPPPWWCTDAARDRDDQLHREQLADWIRELKRRTRDELEAQQRQEAPTWSREEVHRWADAKQRVSPEVAHVVAALHGPLDWGSLLPRIRCPALLLTADPDRGALVTRPAADALGALVPRLRTVRIDDAGHSIRHDQPDRYLEHVRRFLADTSPTG
jgi:N-formylmaleamate deformylase